MSYLYILLPLSITFFSLRGGFLLLVLLPDHLSLVLSFYFIGPLYFRFLWNLYCMDADKDYLHPSCMGVR